MKKLAINRRRFLMKVNIVGNIRSLHQFHYPTKVYKRELLELGIETQYYFDVLDKQIYSCDVLIFSEENYRNLLPIKNKDREHSIEFLKQYLGRFPKVIWFDGHDGSGWLRSYVFPFIDKYTKSSLMKDTSYYKEKHTIGIAHRDYVSETHEIDDPKSSKEVLTDNDLTKLTLSWNYAYKNWNHLINNWFFMNRPTIGRILNKFVKDTYKLTYTDPNLINRGKILQYRMNYWPKYGTVKWWREQTLNHIKEVVQTVPIYQLQSTDRVKKQQFIKEIKNSVVTVSPFGLG